MLKSPKLSKNSSLKKTQKKLYLILTIQLTLAILKFLKNPNMAINELISSLLFFCGIYYLNFCLLAFYCIFSLFHILQYISILGIRFQLVIKLEKNFFGENFGDKFFFFLILVSLFFGLVFQYLIFRAYRHFKFQNLKNFLKNGNFNKNQDFMDFERFKGGSKGLGGKEDLKEGSKGMEGFEAFKGEGIRLG